MTPIPYADAMDGARTVAEWAHRAGVSRKALCRRVVRVTGHTPDTLMRLARVLYVLEIAQKEQCTIASAAETQYPDPYTFSSACVRALGVRPSVARYMDLHALVREKYGRAA